MFWKIIERAVNLTYLLLAATIISMLLTNTSQIKADNNATRLLELYKEENASVRSRNINYLENKINNVASSQDSYQISTTTRVNVLESRIKLLEDENKALKQQGRIINNNNSNATINMPIPASR